MEIGLAEEGRTDLIPSLHSLLLDEIAFNLI